MTGNTWTRRLTLAALLVALAAATLWALWPRPLAVDLAAAVRGPMRETIAADGITRVREPYAIMAPISGMLERSPVQVGDTVIEGETVVARFRPAEPALMDARTRAQAEAAVVEAEAGLALAEANFRRALTSLSSARTELERARRLAQAGTLSQRALEDAENAFTQASQAVTAARAEKELAAARLARARAQLLTAGDDTDAGGGLEIRAPVSGTVLEVAELSARPVAAGAPILSIGDLRDLEIEVELLSSDAVRVRPGAEALVERWGGDALLPAVVRRVSPAAYTRVSALGIEEQRVRVLLDFRDGPETRPGLGDRYRVHVRVVTWAAQDVLKVPQGAVFRHRGGWAVFRHREGAAVLTPVEIGHQAEGEAEVLGGLEPGAEVVLFPPATLADGAAIRPRAEP